MDVPALHDATRVVAAVLALHCDVFCACYAGCEGCLLREGGLAWALCFGFVYLFFFKEMFGEREKCGGGEEKGSLPSLRRGEKRRTRCAKSKRV